MNNNTELDKATELAAELLELAKRERPFVSVLSVMVVLSLMLHTLQEQGMPDNQRVHGLIEGLDAMITGSAAIINRESASRS